MKYTSLEMVKNRIDKNYKCIKEIEELIFLQNGDEEKLELISFIGMMYAEYVTGVYSSNILEKYIIDFGKKLDFYPTKKAKDNEILIVMSACGAIGGHTLLVHNWISWDVGNCYSIVFTERNGFHPPRFLKDAVKKSGGRIMYLAGTYTKKSLELLELSQKFKSILMFTHMNDVIPVLAYSNKSWEIPVYFYNHADFKFSFGFSVADIVMNLCPFDMDKTIRYRGICERNCVYLQFPDDGKAKGEKTNKNQRVVSKNIREKYGVKEHEKLIVSMGDDFKFGNIIGYEFDDYVDKILKRCEIESSFLIIGADNSREKWIHLEEKTHGKGRALGRVPRGEAEQLIAAADLFVISFPMMAAGKSDAERAKVPWLCLNMYGRCINDKSINIANSIEELIEKTLDILNGNKRKYLLKSYTEEWTRPEWTKKWQKTCNSVAKHELHTFYPHRYIEKHEMINCQLMQEGAGRNISRYLEGCHLNWEIRKAILDLDCKYEMGISKICDRFWDRRYNDLSDSLTRYIRLSDKHFELYFTAMRWIELKQDGKRIDKYLLEQGYCTVAVYGMSYMGERLVQELRNSSINVLYGIDRNAKDLQAEVKLLRPSDELESVDVIINTTIINNLEILKEINIKNVKMIYLDELLELI